MDVINVGATVVGKGCPCYVIAEAGSNHNGEYDNACALIDVAVDAGADAVKFQIFSAPSIYSKKTPMASYLEENELTQKGDSLYDAVKRLEIPRDWIPKLSAYCSNRGITFLATPFDEAAVDQLEAVDVAAYKVASFEITHLPLLEKIGATRKPMLLSTGMANLEDIEVALEHFYQGGGEESALFHCAIAYPPRFEDLNLKAMETMQMAFQVPVGFSDHTMGYIADVAAVARGACLIEKHFTLSRSMDGPDHPFALEPHELKDMVDAIRKTEQALGSPLKRATAAEQELHRIGRRSLVAATNIPMGAKITAEMIAVKRPGFGIPTRFLSVVIGREARVDIAEDDILQWEMI